MDQPVWLGKQKHLHAATICLLNVSSFFQNFSKTTCLKLWWSGWWIGEIFRFRPLDNINKIHFNRSMLAELTPSIYILSFENGLRIRKRKVVNKVENLILINLISLWMGEWSARKIFPVDKNDSENFDKKNMSEQS